MGMVVIDSDKSEGGLMDTPTLKQQQVLDEIRMHPKSVEEIANGLLLPYSVVHGRLFALWRKRMVDRKWGHGLFVWFATGVD